MCLLQLAALNEEVIKLQDNHSKLLSNTVTISTMEKWEESFEGEKKTSKKSTTL